MAEHATEGRRMEELEAELEGIMLEQEGGRKALEESDVEQAELKKPVDAAKQSAELQAAQGDKAREDHARELASVRDFSRRAKASWFRSATSGLWNRINYVRNEMRSLLVFTMFYRLFAIWSRSILVARALRRSWCLSCSVYTRIIGKCPPRLGRHNQLRMRVRVSAS